MLSISDIERLINSIKPYENPKKIRLLALVELMYSTGVRVEELVSLLLQSINLEKSYLLVRGKGDKEEEIFQIAASHPGRGYGCGRGSSHRPVPKYHSSPTRSFLHHQF